MPYVLCLIVIGRQRDLRITEGLYKDIKAANEGLPEIVAAEEKFDALMENFVELESTLLTLGARHLAFVDIDLKDFLLPRNLISRRTSNFLSSARLYRDALPQHVIRILGRGSAASDQFNKRLKDKASQPMSFRIVEAIRNYVQHQELPISGISFHRKREGVIEQNATAFAYWLDPAIDAFQISKSRDLDSDVRAALAQLGQSVNPMSLFREYIQYIGTIHDEFRKLINTKESSWEGTITSTIARYKRRYPRESTLGLAAGFRHENRTVSDPWYLSEQQQDYRKYLKSKHLTAANFAKRYVKWSA